MHNEKFNLKKGEILIIRIDNPGNEEEIYKIREQIEILAQEEGYKMPPVLFLSHNDELELLNENDLNSYGWYRKKNNTVEDKLIKNNIIF